MTKRKTYYEREIAQKNKINDLKPFQKHVNVIFKVLRKLRTRKIQKNNTFVSECLIGDDTGTMLLTVWNEDIGMLEVGEYFTLYGGYVNIHREKLKLNKTKYGEIEPCLNQDYEINTENNLSSKKYDEALTLLKTKKPSPEAVNSSYNLGQDNVKIIGMEI